MNTRKFLFGTISLGVLYLLFGPGEINGKLLLSAPVEGVLYSLIVLIAHENKNRNVNVAFVVLTALLNFLVVQFWWFLAAIPIGLGSESLPSPINTILVFSFNSAAGALLFAFLLDWLLQPSYFSGRTYFFAIAFTSIAGIPLAIQLDYNVEMHKVFWWMGFSLALIVSNHNYRKLNANNRMQSDRSTRYASETAADAWR